MLPNFSLELAEAKEVQKAYLPLDFKNQYLSVTSIYTPFSQVSGDCLGFWWVEREKTLYGYIFDVTGHSLASAMQVSVVRLLFYQASKKTSNISEMLKYINNEIFLSNYHRTIATAIIFAINPLKKVIEYSSAGISPFYIFGETQHVVKTSGYPLGYKKNSEYQLSRRSIENVNSLIFASDGFTELYDSQSASDGFTKLYDSQSQVIGMHDDATAILIKPSERESLWVPAELPSLYYLLSNIAKYDKSRNMKGETNL